MSSHIPTYCESCNRIIDINYICECSAMEKCLECDYRIGDGYYHKSSCSYYIKPKQPRATHEMSQPIESKRSTIMTTVCSVPLDPTFDQIGVPIQELELKNGMTIMDRKPSLDISKLKNTKIVHTMDFSLRPMPYQPGYSAQPNQTNPMNSGNIEDVD